MAKKQFLYENVYNDLKQKIECGDLKPGDKLAVKQCRYRMAEYI